MAGCEMQEGKGGVEFAVWKRRRTGTLPILLDTLQQGMSWQSARSKLQWNCVPSDAQ
jgi:hypothetical protein